MLVILNGFFRLHVGPLDFGRLVTPPVPHHLHDDDDAVEGQQHGLLAELEAEPTKCESTNPLGFCWRVPLSWVHNPYGVLALYQDQLDTQTHDQVIIY